MVEAGGSGTARQETPAASARKWSRGDHELAGRQAPVALFDRSDVGVDGLDQAERPHRLGDGGQPGRRGQARVVGAPHEPAAPSYRLHPSGAFRSAGPEVSATPILLRRKAPVVSRPGVSARYVRIPV